METYAHIHISQGLTISIATSIMYSWHLVHTNKNKIRDKHVDKHMMVEKYFEKQPVAQNIVLNNCYFEQFLFQNDFVKIILHFDYPISNIRHCGRKTTALLFIIFIYIHLVKIYIILRATEKKRCVAYNAINR